MEDNHCVIMDKCPSNQVIVRIHMTSNKMFPLAFNPSEKKNIGKKKYAQLETTFTTKTAHSSKENSTHSIKKGENDAQMKESFQFEVQDYSCL
jgi:hypothetical protein